MKLRPRTYALVAVALLVGCGTQMTGGISDQEQRKVSRYGLLTAPVECPPSPQPCGCIVTGSISAREDDSGDPVLFTINGFQHVPQNGDSASGTVQFTNEGGFFFDGSLTSLTCGSADNSVLLTADRSGGGTIFVDYFVPLDRVIVTITDGASNVVYQEFMSPADDTLTVTHLPPCETIIIRPSTDPN